MGRIEFPIQKKKSKKEKVNVRNLIIFREAKPERRLVEAIIFRCGW